MQFAFLLLALVQDESLAEKLARLKAGNETLAESFPPYAVGAVRASRAQRPLVVFVGVKPRQVSGALVSVGEALTGCDGPAVVVALPDSKGWLYWAATLPPNATDEEIANAINPPRATMPALRAVNC